MGLDAGSLGAMASLTGGVGGLAGGFEQAGAIRGQGRFRSQVAQQNARLSELQAADALERGRVAANLHGLRTGQVIGAQRASFAGQGVDVNYGSAAKIQADAAGMGMYDQMTIRNNAAREAWGFKVQAQNETTQGRLAALAATNEANATILTGGQHFARSAMTAAYFMNKNTPTYQGGQGGGSGEEEEWAQLEKR